MAGGVTGAEVVELPFRIRHLRAYRMKGDSRIKEPPMTPGELPSDGL